MERPKGKVKMGKSGFRDATKEKHKLKQAINNREINRKGHHKFYKVKCKMFKTNSKGFFT